MDRVHRPKLEIRFLSTIIIISIFAIILQYFVDKYVQIGNVPGQYFRQELLYILGGIAIMSGIYFIDYTLIGKYPLLIWIGFCILSFFGIWYGKRYSSTNEWSFLLSYLFLPLYAGVLFRFRKYQQKGLLLSGVAGIFPILICFLGKSIAGAVHYSIIALIMICFAVSKGWFGNRKKLNFSIVLGGTAIFTALIVFFCKNYYATSYQLARINAALRNDNTNVLFYQSNAASDSLKHLELIGKSTSVSNQIPAVESKYILIFILQTFGILAGILITIFFLYLLFGAFRIVRKQKNYLAYMVSLSCSLILAEQIIGYVICNFFSARLSLLINQQYFPFLSRGGRNILCSFIISGLLLSVYRNTDLVSNKTISKKSKKIIS